MIVEGVWNGGLAGSGGPGRMPILDVTAQTVTGEPAQPYEY